VVTIALLASWVAAVVFVPYLGKNSCRTWRRFMRPNTAR
jgi:multidrug efflux pump subunit AcrB